METPVTPASAKEAIATSIKIGTRVALFWAVLSHLKKEDVTMIHRKLTRSFLYDREIAFILFKILKKKARHFNYLYETKYECPCCNLCHYLLNYPNIRQTITSFINDYNQP